MNITNYFKFRNGELVPRELVTCSKQPCELVAVIYQKSGVLILVREFFFIVKAYMFFLSEECDLFFVWQVLQPLNKHI